MLHPARAEPRLGILDRHPADLGGAWSTGGGSDQTRHSLCQTRGQQQQSVGGSAASRRWEKGSQSVGESAATARGRGEKGHQRNEAHGEAGTIRAKTVPAIIV